MDVLDDLVACGADILNPQDLCNGVEELAMVAKGRVCIDLDVDRQSVVLFGTPRKIEELIEYAGERRRSPGRIVQVADLLGRQTVNSGEPPHWATYYWTGSTPRFSTTW